MVKTAVQKQNVFNRTFLSPGVIDGNSFQYNMKMEMNTDMNGLSDYKVSLYTDQYNFINIHGYTMWLMQTLNTCWLLSIFH